MFHRRKILSTSVVGLLVILLCGGLILVLAIPGIQSAREQSRLDQCAKNLSDLSKAATQYNEYQLGIVPITSNSDGVFPSWAAMLAPYAEQGIKVNLFERADSETNLATVQSYNNPLWQCPSRRSGQVYDFPAAFAPGGPGISFEHAMPTDYAPGHSTTADIWNVHADGTIINPLSPATAARFPVSVVSFEDIKEGDGKSYTALLGEKHMLPEWLGAQIAADDPRGLDIPALVAANSPSSIRLAGDRLEFGELPLATGPDWGLEQNPHAMWAFGSWHLQRSHFLKVDGSVKAYAAETSPIVLRSLISRSDGLGETAEPGEADEEPR